VKNEVEGSREGGSERASLRNWKAGVTCLHGTSAVHDVIITVSHIWQFRLVRIEIRVAGPTRVARSRGTSWKTSAGTKDVATIIYGIYI